MQEWNMTVQVEAPSVEAASVEAASVEAPSVEAPSVEAPSVEAPVEGAARSGSVHAISISTKKGIPKRNVGGAELREEWGIVGDAHAGAWHRQVSLLAMESIETMRAKGLNVRPGAFAENITTQFITLPTLRVGTRLRIGATLLEITQIGKECHARCAIYYAAGDCVMPREGIFARVLEGGVIAVGDAVEVLEH